MSETTSQCHKYGYIPNGIPLGLIKGVLNHQNIRGDIFWLIMRSSVYILLDVEVLYHLHARYDGFYTHTRVSSTCMTFKVHFQSLRKKFGPPKKPGHMSASLQHGSIFCWT